jgi:hypothetical protein
MYGIGVSAQDLIVKTDSTRIVAKITEVSEYEIRYIEYENLTGPIFILGVDKIEYVVYSNGKVANFKGQIKSLNTDIDAANINSKNIVKISPFSPITGHLDFEYERVFSKRMSYTTEFGIIGINGSEDLKIKGQGAFVSGGVRMYKGQEIRRKNTYYNNNFSGFYLQAKIGFEAFRFDYSYKTYENGIYKIATVSPSAIGGSFMLGLGMQSVFAGRISVDLGGGLGYVIVNEYTYERRLYSNGDLKKYTEKSPMFSSSNFGRDFGISGDAWVRIGYIF